MVQQADQADRRAGVSVIMLAGGRNRQLGRLLHGAKRIAPKTEVIVVCSPDDAISAAHVKRRGGSLTLVDPALSIAEKIAIGASQAAGNILLFLDGSVWVPANRLKRYITSVQNGNDLVLSVYASRKQSPRTMAYQLLNHVAGRRRLASGSLCEMPFAMNRHVWDTLDFSRFSPPMAQARAVVQGLSLGAVRLYRKMPWLEAADMALPDAGVDHVLQEHAKAISLLLQEKGARGGMWDGNRHRPLLQVPGGLHFRSVYRAYREDWEMKRGGGWGEERKAKRTYSRKKK